MLHLHRLVSESVWRNIYNSYNSLTLWYGFTLIYPFLDVYGTLSYYLYKTPFVISKPILMIEEIQTKYHGINDNDNISIIYVEKLYWRSVRTLNVV